MSKERLLSALSESKLVKIKKNFNVNGLNKILEDFNELRNRFSKT